MQLVIKKQIWIAMCMCLGSFVIGFGTGWITPLLHKLQDIKQTPLPTVINVIEASWVGSVTYIGLVLGPYLAGFLVNTLGRKPCLFIGGVAGGAAYVIHATAVNLAMVITGQLIIGAGYGILFVIILIYTTEISSTNIRGTLITLNGVSQALGTVMCYALIPYVSYTWATYITLILSLTFLVGACLVPETPVFYLLKGNEEKAKEILKSLNRSESEIEGLAAKEMDSISSKSNWIQIFTVKTNRKALFITVVLSILQNCGGVDVVRTFATVIFSFVQSNVDSNVATIIVGMTMFVASCLVPFVVDRYGRKILLIVSSSVSSFCMLLLGTYFYLDYINHWVVSYLQLLPVITLVGYCLFFYFGFAIIPVTLIGEMFESNVRGTGSTLTLTIGWLFGFLSITTFGYIKTSLGTHTAFWGYAVICGLASVFTALFVPETKRKTFSEIQYILMKLEGYLKKQLHIAGWIYIGQILIGYTTAWSAPIIPKLQNPAQTPLDDVITDGQSSWVGSLLFVGCITGPYIAGYLSNRKGRKACLFLGAAIHFLSYVVLAVARNVATVYTGRMLTGLGSGIISVTNLVYIGEMASTNIRGILLTSTGIFMTIGTLIMFSVGPYVPYAVSSWIPSGISILYGFGILLIPESPVYQVLIGEENQAKENLISLGRENDIEKVLASKQNNANSATSEWTEIFTDRINLRALFITSSLTIFQQMSGVLAVVFFATSIFELAGSSIDPNIATIIMGITQLTGSCVAPIFVEKTGRKSLLSYSTAGCCLSLTMLGLFFFLDKIEHHIVSSIKWLPLVCLIIFFLFYDTGFGIIPGTLTGEMFKSNVRSSGSALAVTTGWMFGFGVSSAFGYMVPALGADVTFWIYAMACAFAFFFTLAFVPETKGKSLLEIQEMLISCCFFNILL